jgi:hypothetical protein
MRRQLVLNGFSVLMILVLCAAMVPVAGAKSNPACPADGQLLGAQGKILCVEPKEPLKKASIVLTVVNPPAGAWASVEWLDLSGKVWTAVPGWSGLLAQNENGFMPFAVDDADVGTGPFRWVVYDKDPAQGGKVWGMTESFNLPQKHEWLWFNVNKK